MMCQYLAHSLALCYIIHFLYFTALYKVVLLKYPVSVVYKRKECVHFVHRFYLKVELIINDNKQELMIFQELFDW